MSSFKDISINVHENPFLGFINQFLNIYEFNKIFQNFSTQFELSTFQFCLTTCRNPKSMPYNLS